MRVKVGDQWFGAEPGKPIMIEVTQQDKDNIQNMVPGATKYAVFTDDDEAFPDNATMFAWMRDGAKSTEELGDLDAEDESSQRAD